MVRLRTAILLWWIAAGSAANKVDFHQNSESCDCYVTDGNSSAYYSAHRFFDFRNFTSSDGLDYSQEPANVTDSENEGLEETQRGFLNSTDFSKDWLIRTWGRDRSLPNTPVAFQNSAQNVFIRTIPDNSSMTELVLRTHRNNGFSSTGEVESTQKNVFHASIRLHARVQGASGAVAGMFTYLNDSQESDIEILTRDPTNLIRYTNQPDEKDGLTVKQSEVDPTLPDGTDWTDWNTHRLDWTPDVSAWYVNDVFVASNTYGIPSLPSYLTLNMWSNGASWSGNMTIGEAAYLEIQWIEMVFNTSGPATGYDVGNSKAKRRRSGGCGTVCAVDGVRQVGFPEVVHQDGKSSGAVVRAGVNLDALGIVIVGMMLSGC